MSERRHTPGPWSISRISETMVEAAGRSICSAGAYQQNFDTERVYDENRANARLIAAAPDLLAALKLADRRLHDDGYTVADPVTAAIRAAITRVEGRS